jgi:transcriptional regulator with GAF, ATPase, and Fis domain/CHASE2 domain-containing sensor protein
LKKYTHIKELYSLITVLFTAIVLIVFNSIRLAIDDTAVKIFDRIKSETQPDSNIVLIHITDHDIQQIGGWPIKRSYYALLIKNLSELGVKKIGLEIFLSAKFVTQTVYDNLLKREIEKAGSVVLSSYAAKISYENGNYYSDSLSFPSPKLLNDKIITGHLNYIENGILKVPLIVHSNGIEEPAFAAALADIKSSNYPAAMELNFISSWNKFRNYSLLDFFDLLNKQDESLTLLKNKLVVIGLSSEQYSVKIKSSYDNFIPGIALHAFAVDNLINGRFFNSNFYNSSAVIFIILILLSPMLKKLNLNLTPISTSVLLLIVFMIISFSAYSYLHLRLANSFFILPLFFRLITDAGLNFARHKARLKDVENESEVLKKLLHWKEMELENLQKELDVTGDSETSVLVSKIRSLKEDIEKLKSNEDDKISIEPAAPDYVQNFHGIVYKSKAMKQITEIIEKTAPEDASILILGESGTGKELAAKAIHTLSRRSSENFVAVNCGALPENLLESELFGHVKGSFTGAVSDKEGRFEAANNGTIFLDEIAETSENFQVKLLRVVQSGEFERVGSSKTIHVDVRIIAATNKDLVATVKERKFREDLYYRLNVIQMVLPPLRERKEDIPALASHFLQKENSTFKMSKAFLDALSTYNWKGNVRELESVIKRAAIFAKTSGRSVLQTIDLPDEIRKKVKYNFEDLVLDSLRNKKFSHASINETAKELGNVSRTLVSENFRGLALKEYIERNRDINKAAEALAGTSQTEVIERTRSKLQKLIANIEADIKSSGVDNLEALKLKHASKYKNLPQKFHYYLDEVIRDFIHR